MIPSAKDISRRVFLGAACASSWLGSLATTLAADPGRRRSCILLWMNGGPSTIDLWDLKPGHANGGSFRELTTNVPEMHISEHLPHLATHAHELAIIRSLTMKEGDHSRARHLLRTGYVPQGAIRFPTFGAAVARELTNTEAVLPPYVCISPPRYETEDNGGFLGARFNPLVVGTDSTVPLETSLQVPNISQRAGGSVNDLNRRLAMLEVQNRRFGGSDAVSESRRIATVAASRLMRPETAQAFDLNAEAETLRRSYGMNLFGQGCLLARRLVERGVPFVEVTLDGWDTHVNNFERVKELSGTVDAAFSSLLTDLKDRGLLDSTLIVWAGEFGRTPKINPGLGRDHWPAAFSAVLAGGGVAGGQAYGRTSADGSAVEEKPVGVPDLLATICQALGVDSKLQNMSNVDRPIRLVAPAAEPIKDILL